MMNFFPKCTIQFYFKRCLLITMQFNLASEQLLGAAVVIAHHAVAVAMCGLQFSEVFKLLMKGTKTSLKTVMLYLEVSLDGGKPGFLG